MVNISVIIPVYNDPCGLKDTLRSLLDQDLPGEQFEIIVVDNGSTDSTAEVAKEFVEEGRGRVKFGTESETRSSYAARNKGISLSRGEIIAFIDADMVAGRAYLSRVLEVIYKKDIDYLGCNVILRVKRENIFSLYNRTKGFPVKRYLKELHFAPTCCLAVRRKVIDDVGMFDPRLISGGDFEFGNRVYGAGRFKMQYAPDISLEHPARGSFKSLCKKRFRMGQGIRQLNVHYPEYFGNRTFYIVSFFLPPHPYRFFKKVSRGGEEEQTTIINEIFFYFIRWALKTVSGAGYVYKLFLEIRKRTDNKF